MNNKTKFNLCLIIGEDELPFEILNTIQKNEVFIIALKEANINLQKLAKYNYKIISFVKVGKIIKTIKSLNIKNVCFAGRIKKPSFFSLKPDLKGLFLLFKIIKLKMRGDNNLLKTIINFVKSNNIEVKGVNEIAPKLITPKGILTSTKPTKLAMQDCETGANVIKNISQFDIGQAIVMQEGVIIGVEAIEGTDELIKRCGALKSNTKNLPILIKCAKKNQTLKIDMPTIGIETIKMITKYGFAGIYIEANSTLLLQQNEVINFANENNIFIMGF